MFYLIQQQQQKIIKTNTCIPKQKKYSFEILWAVAATARMINN